MSRVAPFVRYRVLKLKKTVLEHIINISKRVWLKFGTDILINKALI